MMTELRISGSSKQFQADGILVLELFNINGFTPQVLQALEDWTSRLWSSVGAGAIHSRTKEMVEFTRSVVAGLPLLGRTIPVQMAHVERILTIDDTEQDEQILSFDALSNPPVTIESFVQVNHDDLRHFKTMVKKLVFKVDVPKKIWDLSMLNSATQFALVDFPGVGSDDSAIRDAFLCKQEIADMQTLLMLINAKRPGSGDSNQLYSMISQGYKGNIHKALIVGIARFNEVSFDQHALDLGDDEDDDLLGDILGDALSSETNICEEDVFRAHESIRRLTQSAQKFVNNDITRVSFLMQNCAFTSLIQRGMSPEDLGCSQLINQLEKHMQPTIATWEYWSRISCDIGNSNNQSILGRIQAADPLEGGGVNELRELIVNHVSENGLKALEMLIKQDMSELEERRKELIEISKVKEDISQQQNPDISQLINQLRAYYTDKMHELSHVPTRLQVGESGALIDYMETHTPYLFGNSDEFQALMNKVDSSSLLLPKGTDQKAKIDLSAIFGNDEDLDESKYAQEYADLKDLFNQSIEALEV